MEITEIVKPFIRRGATQYFCQYSVCVAGYVELQHIHSHTHTHSLTTANSFV